jgi:hypothetical protein
MKNLQDSAALFFVTAVAVLGLVSVLGVWDFFSKDVILKSFETLGLLAVVAVVIIVAGNFIETKGTQGVTVPLPPNPAFRSMRRLTLGVLILSAALLALLGVMVIWEVIANSEVLYKSLSSLCVIAFCSFIIVMTCLEREGNPHFGGKKMSVGTIVLLVLGLYLVLAWGSMLFRW